MKVTLDLPDEWAESLPKKETELAEILAAGLRRRDARKLQQVDHLADIVDTLAELPSPEQILALRPSQVLSDRIDVLLAKKRNDGFTAEESGEWEDIIRLEHLMRVAKAKAVARLKPVGPE